MKKDTKKKPGQIPATLTLESVSDFAAHVTEIDAKRVYLTFTDQPVPGVLHPFSPGDFSVVATARTDTTVLQLIEPVQAVTQIDAFARPTDSKRALDSHMARMKQELEKLGFEVKKGRWSV